MACTQIIIPSPSKLTTQAPCHCTCYSIPFTELHEHACTVLLLLWYEHVLFTNKVISYKVYILLLNQVSCMSVFPLESYIHERAYSHRSLMWWEKGIIKPYKFYASMHSGRRVTQHAGLKLFSSLICPFPNHH